MMFFGLINMKEVRLMSKYNIGDRVRIKSKENLKKELEDDKIPVNIKTRLNFLIKFISIYCEKEVTISFVDEDGDYFIKEYPDSFVWTDDMFEELVSPVSSFNNELESIIDKKESLIEQVEKLNNNTPEGRIVDGDTILADLIENNDFELPGMCQDIFNIWKNSTDKEAVEQMFFEFTGLEFVSFLEKCKEEISR